MSAMTAAEDRDQRKLEAAERALALVTPGMKLGLGSGSTAHHFVDLVGERVKAGLDIHCVATSEATAAQAKALGIPVGTLDDIPELDLTVDGADEIDSKLRLIKGGGGALLREKIVASASNRMVVIADSKKLVARLGAFPLPIEVVPFGLAATRRHIERAFGELGLAGPIRLRGGSSPFVTDGGHYILDCSLGSIAEPEQLSRILSPIPGVVEHGLFIGLARGAIIAGADGVELLGDTELKIESHLQESFMPARAGIAKGRLALFLFIALSVSARAAGTTPPAASAPAAPTAAAPAPGAPSPAALAAADTILGVIGLKQSIAIVVPGMMAELEANVTRTRPEIRDSLRATLRAIQPEFDQTAKQTYSKAAALLASQMSEKEITEVAAFFDSPAGKKYVQVTPVFLQKLSDVTGAWREKLSTDILERARQEMKKKGVDF